MVKKTRSARGETVDWDLLKVKESIAAGPTPVNVEERERFIDQKLRRKITRRKTKTPIESSDELSPLEEEHRDSVQEDNQQNEYKTTDEPKKKPRKVKSEDKSE